MGNLDSFWKVGKHTDQICFGSKAHSCFSTILTVAATPEKEVASFAFLQLTFICEPGLTQHWDMDVLSAKFSCNKCCWSVRSVCSGTIVECTYISCANDY